MSSASYHAGKLLIFGFMIFGFGIWLASSSWVFKSDLVPINGRLYLAEVHIMPVESSKGSRSNKSELVFYLNGNEQRFVLTENIGSEQTNPEYERIQRKLKSSRNIKVYIDEDDANDSEPKVYQIECDGIIILDFENVRTEHSTLATFMLALGMGSILLYLNFRNKSRA